MYLVGKIDIEIYNCITKDITTDEVIITDERIQHIKEHHPNNYEQYYSYMRSIIENPEYIIEANKPNTALILKSFSNGNETFKTVLRLITSSDNSKFKNSIITFMKINEKEWNRLLKNKKILYKSEETCYNIHTIRTGYSRWKISSPSTRRWLDKGKP